MFTPRMTVAVRVMALNRAEGWFTEERLTILGVQNRTLRALSRAGIVTYRTNWTAGRTKAWGEWRLTPLAECIIDAVRA